jgi:hypothetical protein
MAMGRLVAFVGIAIALVVAGAAAAGPLDPGATLCLRPALIPVEDPEDPRRAALEARLEQGLAEASYEVVGSAIVMDVLKREQAHAPRHDPVTGEVDEEDREAFVERVREALENLGCDAMVDAHVAVVRAMFNAVSAQWDGKSEQVVSTGRFVLNAVLGMSESGWVTALSLRLRVSDLEDRELSYRTAGIESLASLSVTHGKDALPADVWLSDLEKIDWAVREAIGPDGRALRDEGRPEDDD